MLRVLRVLRALSDANRYDLARTLSTPSTPSTLSTLKSPSSHESLASRDLASLSAHELDEIARLATRLARRLVARPSRRWRAAPRGARVDLRRTIRRSLGVGGELVQLARRERKLRKTSLVVVCDVSGSMDLYARFLLQFVYALQNSFARVETFVFATRLSRVTHRLRRQPYAGMLATLGDEVRDWSGGTRIGESLTALEAGWSALIDRRTIVVIMSDGWETGDPAQLGAVLGRLRQRAAKLIWLNPLLGSPAYRPLTGGMQAALPHLDVFAPIHNLESLRALVSHLRRCSRSSRGKGNSLKHRGHRDTHRDWHREHQLRRLFQKLLQLQFSVAVSVLSVFQAVTARGETILHD